MKLKESCDDWSIEFNHNNLDIELTEEQQALIKSVMHVTGDSLGVTFGLPAAEIELRNQILAAIASIYNDIRKQVQIAVEFTIMNQALNSPLEKGFTNEELFGENLTEALRASLKTQEEFGIAEEYLNTEEDDSEDDEEKDNP